MDDWVGQKLEGSYRLTKVLCRERYETSYLAYNSLLDSTKLVKMPE